ncbi:hypothetical protein RUM44_003543 [Polyplax serrata]|uniref:DRBM domain-containing protein n=1 Tax=Polyplax serrata TaxID=468196 RepID=A0ABR1AGR5_POLSC
MTNSGNLKNSHMYANKIILAPMVRVGTLPMRLLALDYGADLVYCEELIDFKLLRSIRKVNDVLGTVDYIDQTDGTIIFRTCQREKDKVILQLGTSDPERAVKVGKLVENDVAGIDINMGCPKEFSIKGGMGAALLGEPEKAEAILRKLVNNLNIPVTCKVRVLNDTNQTIELCHRFEKTGIAAIAIHGRTKDERPQHANRNSVLKEVAKVLQIPVIANGGSKEIESYNDIVKFREETGCSSVMLARAAEWNCSIFSKNGKVGIETIIKEYLKYAIDYDNAPANTKYCIQNILKELQETPMGKKFLEAQTMEQISLVWGMDNYCREKQQLLREMGFKGRREVEPLLFNIEPRLKKPKLEMEKDVVRISCAFLRSIFPTDIDLPKTKLLMWTRKQHIEQPKYNTIQEDKLFQSVVTVNGKKYGSSYWEKNKRWAEQSAAIVGLINLGLLDEDKLKKSGCIL